MPDPITQAADLLLAARRDPAKRLADLPAALKPADKAAAYAIQHKVAATFPGIGGWKVGAPGPDAPPICGALPAAGVVPSPAKLPSATHSLRGIEAEVCFRIGRDLPPRPTPYTHEEVIAAIAAAHPAIEVLESRYLDPDAVDPMTNLADTQSHGGFVYGAPVTDWHGIDFAREKVEQYVDGALQMERVGNPAGDMIRLVVWLANEGSIWAGGLKAGQFVTCGSWTGKSTVGPTAKVRVRFPSLGEVQVAYTA
ncbi:2-keto-4-pentenoate hydratase [Limobrevibacterium gyesilva]|uniref:2-keto-4-pentenoate hydratase n=1 Tax=Limobrevibacterium gyesilva TaxID=2991712 RepID=A0AA41YJN6_9PROT|nr:2-keto-4-pentenoate hydratase [Limobrevibacterium gyesilva]MCW3473332.1 2-keto-4-pentenoate hydratase [Limobrevibacterium gyesilva]